MSKRYLFIDGTTHMGGSILASKEWWARIVYFFDKTASSSPESQLHIPAFILITVRNIMPYKKYNTFQRKQRDEAINPDIFKYLIADDILDLAMPSSEAINWEK